MFTKDEIKELESKLKGPEAGQAIRTIIDSIDTMVTSLDTMKLQVENLSHTCEKFKKIAEDNEKACVDLTTTIKNIHIALNANRETLTPELEALATELGKFVMSSGALKAGVKSNVKV